MYVHVYQCRFVRRSRKTTGAPASRRGRTEDRGPVDGWVVRSVGRLILWAPVRLERYPTNGRKCKTTPAEWEKWNNQRVRASACELKHQTSSGPPAAAAATVAAPSNVCSKASHLFILLLVDNRTECAVAMCCCSVNIHLWVFRARSCSYVYMCVCMSRCVCVCFGSFKVCLASRV